MIIILASNKTSKKHLDLLLLLLLYILLHYCILYICQGPEAIYIGHIYIYIYITYLFIQHIQQHSLNQILNKIIEPFDPESVKPKCVDDEWHY